MWQLADQCLSDTCFIFLIWSVCKTYLHNVLLMIIRHRFAIKRLNDTVHVSNSALNKMLSTHLSYLTENSLATHIWHYISWEVVSRCLEKKRNPSAASNDHLHTDQSLRRGELTELLHRWSAETDLIDQIFLTSNSSSLYHWLVSVYIDLCACVRICAHI